MYRPWYPLRSLSKKFSAKLILKNYTLCLHYFCSFI